LQISQGFSYQSIFKNKLLGSAIMLSSAIGVGTLSMAWSAQAYMAGKSFTETQLSIAWAILNMAAAISAWFPHRSKKILGGAGSIKLICVFIPCGFIALALLPLPLAMASLLLFYLLRGLATPLLKDYVNRHSPADYRATVLSIRSLVIRLGFAALGFIIAAFGGSGTSNILFINFSAVSAASALAALWFFMRAAQENARYRTACRIKQPISYISATFTNTGLNSNP
jgi:hypothetical protein